MGYTQRAVCRSARAAASFGMCSARSKCKMLLQVLTPTVSSLELGEELKIIDRSTYLESCVSKDDNTVVG